MSTKQLATMADVIRELQSLPVYIQAQQTKVDVEDLVRRRWAELEGYTLHTAVSYATGYLTDAINSAMDAPLRGIVVGQRDVYGKGIPLTYPLIQSDGAHKRLAAGFSGPRIDLPAALIDVKGQYKSEYKNYALTSLISVTPLTPEETVKKLLQIAVPVTGIDFARLEKYGVLIVTGTIRGVFPAARFQDGVKAGSLPVLLPTEDTAPQRMVPVLDLSLDREGGTLGVTVSLTRQKYAHPVYEVTDLEMICSRAAQAATDPSTQATLVKNGLAGRRVVAVGEIGYLKSRDQGDLVILNAYAIYEYDPRMVGDGRLPNVAPTPAPAPAPAPYVPPPAPAPAPAEAPAPLPDGWIGPPPGSARRPDPVGCSVSNAQIEAAIREIAAGNGVAPDALTLEAIRAAGRLPAGVPDANISSVLRYLQSLAAAARGETNTVEWNF